MTDFIVFLISNNYIMCVYFLLISYICLIQSQQFHCSDFNTTKFNITVDNGISIKIDCTAMDYDEFKLLFPCNNNFNRNVTLLLIRNCPLPNDGSSISVIPQQLNVSSYRKLIVESTYMTRNLNRNYLRDLYGLENLTLKFRHLSYIPHDLFADRSLKNLTQLNLYSPLQELPHNIFENLENLKYLNIGRNITKLPKGIFGAQLKLERLNLFNNKLQYLTKDMFGHGSAIKTINLQQNNIETLPSDVFELLANLTQIDIESNKIQTLPENLFKNNVNLLKFTLNENRADLIGLPQRLLANLPELEEVIVTCNLENVPETLFSNSKNITKIIMTHNKLEILPEQLLESQINLIELNLSYNQLTMIPKKLLQTTSKLQILKLANNKLKSLERNLFVYLENLELLNLNNNELITSGFKPNFRTNNLFSLFLRNNSISAMDNIYFLPKNLKILDLSYNRITNFFGKHLELLSSIDLTVNLTYNQIQTIKLDDFGKEIPLGKLKIRTDLNHNPLKCDCHLLGLIDYLKNDDKRNINHLQISKHLHLITNDLKCNMPLNFNGTSVKHLNLEDLLCSFEENYGNAKDCPATCKCSIRPKDRTLIVDCSNGTWTSIPLLPDIVKHNLTQIELNMENDQLTELPLSEIHRLTKVTKLLLAGNYLKTLSIETLKYLIESQILKTVSLSHNPLICECDESSLNLYELTQVKNTKFIDSADITCSHYSQLKYLHQLKDACVIDTTIYIVLAVILAIIMLVIALFYKYQKEIKILLYAHNVCLWFVIENELDEDKQYDAYVSYTKKDEEFIVNHLVPKLENGSSPFKLCIPVRDWLAGECIPEKIVQSMANSKRTIVVLSKDYLESEWSKMEFQAAHLATLIEGRKKLIIIKYEDFGEIENLDSDLKLYLNLKLYLKWGGSLFWETLLYEMPHI